MDAWMCVFVACRWLEESRRQWRVSDVPYDWKREALTAMG